MMEKYPNEYKNTDVTYDPNSGNLRVVKEGNNPNEKEKVDLTTSSDNKPALSDMFNSTKN